MEKSTLVVMAAGMGSRYGGLKQMEPMDEHGNLIMDYSVYDAIRAGFQRVVFIIRKENLQIFRECIGDRISRQIEVEYVFQDQQLPDSFQVPEGRIKPFGTGHAVLCCKEVLHSPFVVINADDYYGRDAFRSMYHFLEEVSAQPGEREHYAMAGFLVENTLTEAGSVSRGVCKLNEEHYLQDVVERTCIKKLASGPAYSEDGGETWTAIAPGTSVSMNFWGFTPGLLPEMEKQFRIFLEENLKKNPLKCEFYLPFAVNDMLKQGKADVKVLPTADRWYGVTYKEDRQQVVEAFRKMRGQRLYPESLWDC